MRTMVGTPAIPGNGDDMDKLIRDGDLAIGQPADAGGIPTPNRRLKCQSR